MKTLFAGLVAVLMSFAAVANEQTAEELFKARGANVMNAYKSYEKYLELAKSETTDDAKAKTYWLASQSVYYVGTRAKDNAEAKKYHQLGYEVAAKTVALLQPKWDSLSQDQKETLANGYFWYGANLGKWGEANGVASSLKRWPELQENMKNIIALKMQHVQDYGAFRILGRAFYKLPFPLGSNKKALSYLEKAVEETKRGHDISVNGLNNVFYAQVLIATGYAADAKTLLKSLVSKDAATFNPDRVPETLVEQEEAREMLKKL